MSVQVILLERIESLGQMGDVVTVRPGYARNYLIPQKKALRSTLENQAYFETQRVHLQATHLKRREEAQGVGAKMDNVLLQLVRPASEMGHLYGAVRPKDIVETLEAQGFTIRKEQVSISVPIKSLGMHSVNIVLHADVKVPIQVLVAKSLEEAQAILRGDVEENGEDSFSDGMDTNEEIVN